MKLAMNPAGSSLKIVGEKNPTILFYFRVRNITYYERSGYMLIITIAAIAAMILLVIIFLLGGGLLALLMLATIPLIVIALLGGNIILPAIGEIAIIAFIMKKRKNKKKSKGS